MKILVFNILNKKEKIKLKKIIKKTGNRIIISNNIKNIKHIDKIIIYSTFNFKYIYYKIKNNLKLLKNINKPILAISNCLFLLCKNFYKYKCLNIFKNVLIFKFKHKNIGYKKIYHNKDNNILKNIKHYNFYQYFNNNYYIPLGKYTIAHTNYNISYSAILNKKNIYGIQFDLLKNNNEIGKLIIKNFIKN
ncbi:MAG: hypothetical protein NHG14_00090 [Candidatus Shikimatogenerans bostrichidophilus]|nr:MAG: hypothetical protein NHG14_00090 [Candidatus Shikimatogenerans bostrichidophilus]